MSAPTNLQKKMERGPVKACVAMGSGSGGVVLSYREGDDACWNKRRQDWLTRVMSRGLL